MLSAPHLIIHADIDEDCCVCRPVWLQKLPSRTFRLLLKAAIQTLLLFYCLICKLPKPDTVLVQNPPAIPTLMLCVVSCWWHGAKLVVDWHNFGYTIMGMTMASRHPLVCYTAATFCREQMQGSHTNMTCCTGKTAACICQSHFGLQPNTGLLLLSFCTSHHSFIRSMC